MNASIKIEDLWDFSGRPVNGHREEKKKQPNHDYLLMNKHVKRFSFFRSTIQRSQRTMIAWANKRAKKKEEEKQQENSLHVRNCYRREINLRNLNIYYKTYWNHRQSTVISVSIPWKGKPFFFLVRKFIRLNDQPLVGNQSIDLWIVFSPGVWGLQLTARSLQPAYHIIMNEIIIKSSQFMRRTILHICLFDFGDVFFLSLSSSSLFWLISHHSRPKFEQVNV